MQFCANDPEMLLQAAKIVAPHCDGVDINFGCPQRIAKRAGTGAFLMDDWATIDALIRKLDEELEVPVTAKIRVYDDLETSIKYAEMVEAAGAQLVAVHGRTREQKRASDVRANWAFIREIKKRLKVPVLANGDIRTLDEARKCLEATGADGVLSADPLLENPSLFSDPPFCPAVGSEGPAPGGGRRKLQASAAVSRADAETPHAHAHDQGARAQDGGTVARGVHGPRDWLNTTKYDQLTHENLVKWAKELKGRRALAMKKRARATHPEEERKGARAGSGGGGEGGRHRGTGTGRVCRRGCVSLASALSRAVFWFSAFPASRWSPDIDRLDARLAGEDTIR